MATFGFEIKTRKRGTLWPTNHYKILFDAITKKGAKKSPFLLNPELAIPLMDWTCEADGRFMPRPSTPMEHLDDVHLSFIGIEKTVVDEPQIRFTEKADGLLQSQSRFEFPFHGTTGNSKYENQTKLNLLLVDSEIPKQQLQSACALSLYFHQSPERKNRDLDNLVDAVIPFFNKRMPSLKRITAVKTTLPEMGPEVLEVGYG